MFSSNSISRSCSSESFEIAVAGIDFQTLLLSGGGGANRPQRVLGDRRRRLTLVNIPEKKQAQGAPCQGFLERSLSRSLAELRQLQADRGTVLDGFVSREAQ